MISHSNDDSIAELFGGALRKKSSAVEELLVQANVNPLAKSFMAIVFANPEFPNANKESALELANQVQSWLFHVESDDGSHILFCRAKFCQFDLCGNVDKQDSMNLLTESADLGFAIAQNDIGLCYLKGEGKEKNLAAAVKYFKLASDSGNAMGHHNLASRYSRGEGVQKNNMLAWQYFKKAADLGISGSQFNLAIRYFKGEDTLEKNLPEAFKYFKLSADQGLMLAQFNVGNCYHDGLGVSVSASQALVYYQLAADQGYAAAQNQVGNLLRFVNDGIVKNSSLAFQYYKLAAVQQLEQAVANIADCYCYGEGTDKDLCLAYKTYKWLADRNPNDITNNFQLAYMIQSGYGVEPDEEAAFLIYQHLALDHKHAPSQSNLARCYLLGEGVETNIHQAVTYYELASEQGYAIARIELEKCLRKDGALIFPYYFIPDWENLKWLFDYVQIMLSGRRVH